MSQRAVGETLMWKTERPFAQTFRWIRSRYPSAVAWALLVNIISCVHLFVNTKKWKKSPILESFFVRSCVFWRGQRGGNLLEILHCSAIKRKLIKSNKQSLLRKRIFIIFDMEGKWVKSLTILRKSVIIISPHAEGSFFVRSHGGHHAAVWFLKAGLPVWLLQREVQQRLAAS